MKVYAVNLKTRKDRKAHIKNEYAAHKGFELRIIAPIAHEIGAVSLWRTLISLIQDRITHDEEYFIFCEDDHQFTEAYSPEALLTYIESAKLMGADVLLGGVSWFDVCVKSPHSNLYWLNSFTGAQFMILFNGIFNRILDVATFTENDALDRKISMITSNIFVIYPFISTQKEFGYSDVTKGNNMAGRVDYLFQTSTKRMSVIEKANEFIHAINIQNETT